jgi:hypothetical protein
VVRRTITECFLRRALITTLALILTAPLAAQPTFAPAERGAIELAADLGWVRYDAGVVRPDGGRLGLFFSRHLTPRLAWTFDITCTGGTPVGASEMDSFTICTGSLGAQQEFAVMRRVRPYVRGSAGQAQLDWQAELDLFDIDERSGATLVAVGSRIALGHRGRFALRAEAAWMRHDLLDGPATHRAIALGITWRAR